MRNKSTFLVALSIFVASYVQASQDIYVSTSGNDTNLGTNISPYATLAKATSMVSEDGATIHVASGTYIFSNTAVLNPYTQTIEGASAISTVFDGNNTVSLLDGFSTLHNSGKTITIKQLSFKNGSMTDVANVKDGGAAISIGVKTNLYLEDCVFEKNIATSTATGHAGAIYFCGNSITVNRCFFDQNTSASTGVQGYGGAITVRHLFNTDNGTTHMVFGATQAVIKNSTFYKNAAFSKGGAIYFNKQLDAKLDADDATFVVQNCTFLENTSSGGTTGTNSLQHGSAIALSSGSNSTNNKDQTIILTNNTFCNNAMLSAGSVSGKNAVLLEGFRYTAYLANNLITSNASNGESLYANQAAPMEYGMNNIIDKINANINGTDFTTDATTKNNAVTTISATDLKLNSLLTGYPLVSTFSIPYLEVASGSSAINGGTNSYLINTIANPAPAAAVEYILQSDILGTVIQNSTRDIGSFEFSTSTVVKNNIEDTHKMINESTGVRITHLNMNDKIAIYNVNGMLMYRKISTADQVLIPLVNKGLYVISINGVAHRHYFK